MAAGGSPKPSYQYVERQLLTRLTATPAPPSGLTSNVAAYQVLNQPPQGTVLTGDGLVLANVFAVVVSVYPWVNATLSGAGSLLCWVYNLYQGRWTRCDDLDIDLSNTSGYVAYTKSTFRNAARLGNLINWLASGVTVSLGTDVLVQLDAFTSVGGQGAS